MVIYIVALTCAFLTAQGEANTSYIQEMNVVYAEPHGIGLLMDVFKPKGKPNGRAIVDIVSSAGNTERINIVQHTHWRIYETFCAHGYTVFGIRPGSGSKWSTSEVRDHIRMGIRYVKAHAKEYGIEPELLGVIGISAGGYLTCLTAVTPVEGDPNAEDPLMRYSTRVAAAAPICPGTGGRVRDLGEGDEYLKIAKRFGMPLEPKPTREEVAKRVAEFSPIAMVRSDSPPFLFTHATGDPIVSFENSVNMAKVLKEANVDVEVRAIDSKEHVWDATIPADIEVIALWFDKKLKVGEQ